MGNSEIVIFWNKNAALDKVVVFSSKFCSMFLQPVYNSMTEIMVVVDKA